MFYKLRITYVYTTMYTILEANDFVYYTDKHRLYMFVYNVSSFHNPF